jgi:hypothetical protein
MRKGVEIRLMGPEAETRAAAEAISKALENVVFTGEATMRGDMGGLRIYGAIGVLADADGKDAELKGEGW